jgi:hypothetical protein
MGRFCALVLVLAACGDNDSVPTFTRQGAPTNDGYATGQTPVNLEPTICGVQTWTPNATTDPTTQLVVAQQTTGAAVLLLPAGGGAATGFTVDERMMVATDGTKVAGPTYTSAVLSTVNDRLELSGFDPVDGVVRVSLVDPQLGNPVEILKAPGNMTPTMFEAVGARMAVVADPSGVTAYHFDRDWTQDGSMLITATDTTEGITASAYGDAALVGWSTHDSCYLARLPGFAPADFGLVGGTACWSPQVAGDALGHKAVMVYQYGDNVHVAFVAQTNVDVPQTSLLSPAAKSPRVVFDGTRFWTSYINGHGDMTVGFFDAYNRLHRIDIVGVRPTDKSYQLAMIGGAPWLVALDSVNGYTAHELCVVPQ